MEISQLQIIIALKICLRLFLLFSLTQYNFYIMHYDIESADLRANFAKYAETFSIDRADK